MLKKPLTSTELKAGLVFKLTNGWKIKLHRHVPGDNTKWYVHVWCGHIWADDNDTIAVSDLAELLYDEEIFL